MTDASRDNPSESTDDLIVRYLEGRADRADVVALNAALQEDAELRRRFVTLSTHARCLAELLTAEGTAVEMAESVRPGSAGRAHVRHSPAPNPAFHISRFAYALAAVLAIAAAVAVYFTAFNTRPVRQDPPADFPVATITDVQNVRWGSDPLDLGDELPPQTIRTEGGQMELMLRSGATMNLSDATELRLIGPRSVELTRGQIRSYCPAGAHGFTVSAPGGVQIVDLGTEFIVRVDPAGAVQVYVLEGAVRVMRGGRTAEFVKGAAVTVDDDATPWWTVGEVARAAPPKLTNVALGKTATQSSDHYPGPPGRTLYGAANAVDGQPATFTSTRAQSRPQGTEPDTAPWWAVDLTESYAIHRIVLVNRLSAQSRLRDLTVEVLAEDGLTVIWRSPLLNPLNLMQSPQRIELDLVAATGEPVRGRHVRVSRAYDSDNAGGDPRDQSIDEKTVLSLGDFEVHATPPAADLPHNEPKTAPIEGSKSTSDPFKPEGDFK